MARLSRRSILAGLAALPWTGAALAQQTPPSIRMYKDPSCGCCGGWAEHMRKAGFAVTDIDTADMEAVKQNHKVPENLYSCHTAIIEGHVVEGHVPAAAVWRMLRDKPAILGLSAPGMPLGSPGMETPTGERDIYEIVAFGEGGQSLFARFSGDKEL